MPTPLNTNIPWEKVPRKTIYLTFDDGPNDGTATVLDVLDYYGLKATFFINMNKVNNKVNELLIGRMDKGGHVIGNHGYKHGPGNEKYYSDVDERELMRNYGDNDRRLAQLATKLNLQGTTMPVIRLQGDGRDTYFLRQKKEHPLPDYVTKIANTFKRDHAGWNVEFFTIKTFPRGIEGPIEGVKVDMKITARIGSIKDKIAASINDRDIVLMHDHHWTGPPIMLTGSNGSATRPIQRPHLLKDLIGFLNENFRVEPLTSGSDANAVVHPR